MDCAAASGGGVKRSAAVAAGVCQRGERDVPGAPLPAEGSSRGAGGGEAARRLAARARASGGGAEGSRESGFGRVAAASRRRAVAGTRGGVAVEGWRRDAPGGYRGPAEALGELQPQRDHPAELAHYPSPDAFGGLRSGP